jgi:ATP phosphoribosyltransferase
MVAVIPPLATAEMDEGAGDQGRGNDRPRIATKYVKCAERHFAAKGQQVEVIKLYGSMELAPLVGLADGIVDLVESGNTLKANGLVPLEHIADISSRLVVNKAAWKMKHASVMALLTALRAAVRQRQAIQDQSR